MEGVRISSRRLLQLLHNHKPRPSPAATATTTQVPRRLSSSATSFSTLSTGQATTAISTRNPNPRATSVVASTTTLDIAWDDGHDSAYHLGWLRVNCPSFVNESGHRTLFPRDVRNIVPMLSISEVGRVSGTEHFSPFFVERRARPQRRTELERVPVFLQRMHNHLLENLLKLCRESVLSPKTPFTQFSPQGLMRSKNRGVYRMAYLSLTRPSWATERLRFRAGLFFLAPREWSPLHE